MVRTFFLLIVSVGLMYSCNSSNFDLNDPLSYPVYLGTDLGLNYSSGQSVFKLWAPTASQVSLNFYDTGEGGSAIKNISMKKKKDGVWEYKTKEELLGKFYTYKVMVAEEWRNEVPGPYATAVGVNGKRAMVVDLEATNPEGWENDKKPELLTPSDIILYELHIRDFSIHEYSGMEHKGKFLALTEEGTKSPEGLSTGIDHIKEMGITHLHILPAFDFRSVDESRLDEPQYNWGYDPQNYNVPDGSFSTNPYDGNVRIREFKQMVQALHENGIRVILDVVYNHVGNTEEQSFEQVVPGYYFRFNEDGSFSNASGCGNETASERPMMRKYMIESVKYWVEEYHLDGFRFDLMGVHDITTMNLLAKELHEMDSSLFIYGEGWTAGDSPLPVEERTNKHNMPKVKGIAAFSDDIRDGIKGHWQDLNTKGFVSGEKGLEETIKFGVVASTQHLELDYEMVNYSKAFWSNSPQQTISYVSCHDNNTLWDKLEISVPKSSLNDRKRMDKLANTIVFTSQGIPFLHAGVEFLRSKQLVENSFDSSDAINRIDWQLKAKNEDVVAFYEGLIKMRKEHPAFKMPTAEMVATHLEFIDLDKGMVGFLITGNANDDSWENILVLYNPSKKKESFYIDEEAWTTVFDLDKGYHENGKKVKGEVILDGISAYVFVK